MHDYNEYGFNNDINKFFINKTKLRLKMIYN